jgi:arylsulfatase
LKWTSLEGGTRVPCIIRWPAVIPARQVNDQLTAAIDLLPTLAEACDIELNPTSQNRPVIDGVSVWQSVRGQRDQPHPRTDLLYWDGWAVPQAIRVADWKLYFDAVKQIDGSDQGPRLFHLAQDPAERQDLSETYPEKVSELMNLARKKLAAIEENAMSLGGPALPAKTVRPAKWLE